MSKIMSKWFIYRPRSDAYDTMSDKAKLEYIWLDGYEPTQNMRSKTMVRSNFTGTLEECPIWMFDGSSTKQADGSSSDCLLKPVNIFPDPQRVNGYLVMCEVLNPDGTPHPSNGRATIDDDDDDFWFGFEQEYFIMDVDTQLPLGFPVGGYPGPQGLYYCSVGGKNTHGRSLVEEHADLCLEAGLNFEGINQEVACGQWEFQIFAKGAKQAGDELGLLATCSTDSQKATATTSNTIQNQSRATGMVQECTPTSPMEPCVTRVARNCLTAFVRPSAATSRSTCLSTAHTTKSV